MLVRSLHSLLGPRPRALNVQFQPSPHRRREFYCYKQLAAQLDRRHHAAAQCHPPPGSMHRPPAPDAKTCKTNETLHNHNRRNAGTTSRGTQNLATAQAERGFGFRGAGAVDGPRGPAHEHVRRAGLRPVLLDLRVRVARAGVSCFQLCQLRVLLPQRRHDGQRRRGFS